MIDAGLMRHVNADLGINPITLPASPNPEIIGEEIEWLKTQLRDVETAKTEDPKKWTENLGPRTGAARAQD